jgi:1,4-alpha-glucan branching enzyme
MHEMFNEDVEEGQLPHPNDPKTFERAKLRWDEYGEEGHLAALDRFRQLGAWRRDHVWPLSATPCLAADSARQGRGVIVNWTFEAGVLTLVLNPSGTPSDLACVIRGAPVSTGWFDQHGEVLRLGPWSAVAWRPRSSASSSYFSNPGETEPCSWRWKMM